MDLQKVMIEVMNLDLWILINVGESARKLVKIMRWMVEIAILTSLVAGLLSIYALPRWKLQLATQNDNEYTRKTMKSSTEALIGITDASSLPQAPEIEREINHLKTKALSLEMAFRRMNSQLRTLHFRDKFKEEELADFASEAAGGVVLETPKTESFHEPKIQLSLFGIPLCKPNYMTPRKVIQPWSEAGECWAFRGDRGNIKIELAYPTMIEQVTLEHISPTASLTGKIDSAPREFQITAQAPQGLMTVGTFFYNQEGPSSQSFQTDEKFNKTPIKIITLEILSNWGNPNYTCVYRFKVHGKISL